MKALVYHGPGQKAWEEVPNPEIIDPTDVIVQVDTTTICGPTCTSSRATSPR
jgi:alcohol dehydrogenase